MSINRVKKYAVCISSVYGKPNIVSVHKTEEGAIKAANRYKSKICTNAIVMTLDDAVNNRKAPYCCSYHSVINGVCTGCGSGS